MTRRFGPLLYHFFCAFGRQTKSERMIDPTQTSAGRTERVHHSHAVQQTLARIHTFLSELSFVISCWLQLTEEDGVRAHVPDIVGNKWKPEKPFETRLPLGQKRAKTGADKGRC